MFRWITVFFVMIFFVGFANSEDAKKGPGENDKKPAEASPKMDRVGPGLAVEGYETSGRIKLSDKAVKRLGLSTGKASVFEGAVRIDVEAVVEDRGENFIYIQEADGWMKRVPVKIGSRSGTNVPILSGLTPGTAYVDKGAPLVRLAELDLVSGEEPE